MNVEDKILKGSVGQIGFMEKKRMKFHVVLEKQKEGGFVAYIPELPGCYSQGENREETLENIREAREAYLESLESKRNPVPAVEVLSLYG